MHSPAVDGLVIARDPTLGIQPDRIRDSVATENTFENDLTNFEKMRTTLQPLIDKVWRHCDRTGARRRTVVLKVNFSGFQQRTRSKTLSELVGSRSSLEQAAVGLLSILFPMEKQVRLLGVTLTALNTDDTGEGNQLTLQL